MGSCIYCGRLAGFLRRYHASCRQRHKEAVLKIKEFFLRALDSTIEPPRFQAIVEQIAGENFISNNELHQLAINGLQSMIHMAFIGEEISKERENRVSQFCNSFRIAANELGNTGMRLAKSQVLRRLDEGEVPEKISVENLPLNLERDETVVWLFNNASYYTVRNRTSYVGASHGVSVRLMRGVYYRVGAYKGKPIRTQYLSDEGRGIFVIASRNSYFWSPQKAFKLPMRKILSVHPYSDAIEIMRDAANAAPQIFKLDDPHFACDAIARLCHL